MSQPKLLFVVLCLTFSTATGFAQRGDRGTAPAPKPENTQSRAHIEAAMKIAGNDAFLMNPYDFFCIQGKARPNNVNAPELEPVKIFDNLYAVGNSEATVYALTTTDGILLIDSGFADQQYVASIAHYLDVAKKMNVEVELQNHAIFDGTPERLAKLKEMKAADPNPFIVGNDRYLKMWNIVSECIQAEIARRNP